MSVNIRTTSQFEELRRAEGYYVDKTGFFEAFFYSTKSGRYESPSEVFLFTRPRRFGKTLFMTMLASFFDRTKDSRDLFAGLKVATNTKLCEQWMNRYPVVFLTLKDVEGVDFEDAIDEIHDQIRQCCSLHEYLLTSERVKDADMRAIQRYLSDEVDEITLGRSLNVLTRALACHYEKKPIVLIDEYDVPVAKAHTNGFYDKMIWFERGFLSRTLKDNIYLNFAILTGCLRITKESILTGLNNIDCYDIASSQYADLFGFTQTDVDQLLAAAGCEEKRETIREWYDGYRFGGCSEIYCPWSIMKYLRNHQTQPTDEPEAYWIGTSGNELPWETVTRHPNTAKARGAIASLLAGIPVRVRLNPWMTPDDVSQTPANFWALLYQTGYLTRVAASEEYVDGNLDNWDDLGDGMDRNTAFLVLPNREVRGFWEAVFRDFLSDILSGNTDRLRKELRAALLRGDAVKIEAAVSAVLAECDARAFKEAGCLGVLYVLLWLGCPATTSFGVSGDGVLGMVVPNREERCVAVLGLKRTVFVISSLELERSMETDVHGVLNRMEDTRRDEDLRKEGYTRILHVGIAFHGRKVKAGVNTVSIGGTDSLGR